MCTECLAFPFTVLTLLLGCQEEHFACKNAEIDSG